MAFFLPVPFSPSEECCTLISRRILTYSHPKSFKWQINFNSL